MFSLYLIIESLEQKALRDSIKKQGSIGEARVAFGILLHALDFGSRVATVSSAVLILPSLDFD